MSAGQALFLVGGRGSRLGGLTAATPKPLLPVAGRPFIKYLLDKAVDEGFDDLILLAGYRHEAVDAYAGVWRGARVRVSVEPEPLDTGGAIAHALEMLDDQFLVVNGDTWFDFNWAQLVLEAGERAVIAARRVAPADRYETIDLDGRKVIAIRPRANLAEGLISGGVYRLRRDVFAAGAGRLSLESEVFPGLCAEGLLGAVVMQGAFIDIGVPESLVAAEGVVAPRP